MEKTAKGYRLKNSTHKLINEMKLILNADKDTVITKACKMLYSEIVNKKIWLGCVTKFYNIKKELKNEENN